MAILPIQIGNYRNKAVHCDFNKAINKHISLLGGTGSGKSTQLQKIAIQLAHQEQTVLILDYHSVVADSQIFPVYKEEFEALLQEVDVYREGLSCQLFSPAIFLDGDEEEPVDTVGAILDVLSRTRRLGTKQHATLRRAIRHVFEMGSYETEGFAAIDNALEKNGTIVAETVREKLYPLTAHNVFRSGELFIRPGKINVVRLSKFDFETQTVIAEVLLAYIWRLAMTFQFREQELFIFADEFQNLPSGKGCALGQILSEGRKFGVNLVLATQQLTLQTSSIVQQKLMQSGLILFSRPNMAQIGATAKLIDPVDPDNWMLILRTLGKGEFVALGSLIVDGRLCEKPLKISAFEDRIEQCEIPQGRGTVKMR